MNQKLKDYEPIFSLNQLDYEKRGDFYDKVLNPHLPQREKDRKGRLSPTDGATHCARKAFYYAQPYSVTESLATEAYYEVGKALESFVANLFERQGYLVGKNIRVETDELQLGAELDLLLQVEDYMRVGEVKTKGTKLPNKADPSQLSQLMYYMAYLFTDGVMIHMSRNVSHNLKGDLTIDFINVPLDLEVLHGKITLAGYARWAIDNNLIPGKSIFNVDECGFCMLKSHCFKYEPSPIQTSAIPISGDKISEGMSWAKKFADEFFKKEAIDKRRDLVYSRLQEQGTKLSFSKYRKLFYN